MKYKIRAEEKIAELLKTYGLTPVKLKENSKSKMPDFLVFRNEEAQFYCEVKNIEKDRFLDKRFQAVKSSKLYGGNRPDPIPNRLTTHIHEATKQLTAQPEKKLNVIAFYNQDSLCNVMDLVGVVTGNFYAGDGAHPIYQNFSEGRIKNDIDNIDLIIWLDVEGKPKFLFSCFSDVDKTKKLCDLFGVDIEKIRKA